MTFAPSLLDWLLLVLLASLTIVDHWVFAMVRRPATPERRTVTRVRYYGFLIAYQWALVAGVLALWIGYRRPWSLLLLGMPTGWRFLGACVLAAAYCALAARQSRLLQRRPELRGVLRRQVQSLEDLLPHTLRERAVFRAVAATAGICEEILFRGFLLAFVSHFTGLLIAVPVAALLFGLAHTYQGPVGILKAGVFGLVVTLVALAAASLLAGIVVHMGVDFYSGELGYDLLSSAQQTADAPLARLPVEGSTSELSR
jgi:uncharacterized protein